MRNLRDNGQGEVNLLMNDALGKNGRVGGYYVRELLQAEWASSSSTPQS